MTQRARRFFWGQSLSQAVARAARWYGVEPERLAYGVHAKRHGFVKQPRAVVIEVDPAAPVRPPGVREDEAAATGATPSPRVPEPRREREPQRERESRPERESEPGREPGRPRAPRAEREPRRERRPGADASPRHLGERAALPAAAHDETWHAPDAESEVAAAEAAARLLRLAGLALEPRVRRSEERLDVELAGADEARLAALGLAFLESFEHLLPRAIHGLSGRLVRIRMEGAGLRAARDQALRALARAAAERVAASGRDEELEPLTPAERRIVHLELAEVAGIVTESFGGGYLKRLRIAPRR